MRKLFAALAVLALAACGEEAPKPPAVPSTPAPPPQAAAPAPAPAPAPETKAAEAPKPDPDKELARRVKRALEEDGKVQAEAIDVTAAGGKVTLWGTAPTENARKHAAAVAGKVDGVAGVDNQIKVVKGS